MNESKYYNQIKELIENYEVNSKVRYIQDNHEKLLTNWTIGKLLVEAQGGLNRAKYGDNLIKKWAIKLEKIFGNNVRKIVDEVTENKSLEWKQRKIEAIEKVRKASFEGKMVECADKINNLESLYDLLKEKGEEVWKNFNKPYPEQKWYYTEMYKAVIENAEYNDLFKRYSNILEKVFD